MNNNNSHIAKVHEETATRNAQMAVKRVGEVETKLIERIEKLESTVSTMESKLNQLEQKYYALLSKNFSSGSTSE